MKQLAVIIPMYNEEMNAQLCVRSICKVLEEKLPGSLLWVVNDGSKDKTESILEELSREPLPFKYISHSPNRGYGGALQAGMQAALNAGFEYGLMMDSDLTNDPELIPKFAEMLKEGRYDLIKASRYVKGGGMKGVPIYRQAYTIIGNKIAWFLFGMGIHDCTNGFHAVKLKLVANKSYHERGFSFLLEELYYLKLAGAHCTEIPYTLTARQSCDGASKFVYSIPVLWSYLKYALKAAVVFSPLKEAN